MSKWGEGFKKFGKAALRSTEKGAKWVFGHGGKASEKAAAERSKMGLDRLMKEAEAARKGAKAAEGGKFKFKDTEAPKKPHVEAPHEGHSAKATKNTAHKAEAQTDVHKKKGYTAPETKQYEFKEKGGVGKGTAKKGGENVVNGKSMSGRPGGPGGPVPPKGDKHAFAKEFTLKTGHAFKEFALAHPKMTLGTLLGLGALAYQNHKEQDDGLGAITRLQAILSGGQYKDGHLVGANGLGPLLNQMFSGTVEQQQGGNFYDTIMDNGIGPNRANKVNMSIDRASNEGWYLIGQGNKLIDSTGHVCGDVINGSKDLVNKIVDGAGNIVGERNPETNELISYDTADGQSQDGNYMGNSGQAPTRAQQLSQALGPAELSAGIVGAMMTRSWPFRILAGLTAYNGYQNIKQHSYQAQQSQSRSAQPTVSYDEQPSDEVVVNTGRGV